MSLLLLYILVTLPALGGRALAVRVFGFDDGEGWALGRTLGLVAVGFVAWWSGVVGISGWQWVGVAVLGIGTVVGGIDLWRRRPDWRAMGTAELVFLVAAAIVIVLRLPRPEILNQEKLMDLGIFASLLRAEGFPPPDMWLAGEGLPYYYWGAVIWIVPLMLSKIPLDLSYNLVVAGVGGLTACLLWALGRRAGDGRAWSGWLSVAFGLFAGTADGFRQLLAGRSLLNLDYWHSSRQVTDTITEWPLFTVWLGDLHPHLLSMPLILAAALLAWKIGKTGPRVGLVIATAVLAGVTWAANPWAMPPTLVAAALLIICGDGKWHWPDREGWPRWVAAFVVAVGAWLAAVPFHLSFHPPFQGVKTVGAWTEVTQFLLWAGILLIPVAAAAWVMLDRLLGGGPKSRAVAVAIIAATLVLASQTGRPTLMILAILLAVLVVATVTGSQWSPRPGVALAALGVFLLLVPEIVYVVDTYGQKLHRMNTVFKCYIQAWIFLAIALPALLSVGFERLRTRTLAVCFMAVLGLPHILGMAAAPLVANKLGIDGLAWLDPSDRAIIRYLRTQPRGTTIVEAVGGAYSEYARISSASGLPSFLGWANHEMVWRGHDISRETERRRALIKRVYTGESPEAVVEAVAETGVELVVIGALERRDFVPAQLDVVRAAGTVIELESGGEIVRFDRAESARESS